MRTVAYSGVLVAALAYGCSQPNDDEESQLSAARAANEQIQLAIAESKCGESEGPQRLCAHLKQAQAEIDNTISRISARHE